MEISLPFKQYLLSACLDPETGLGEGAAVNKGKPPHPRLEELLVFQENVIRNDNTHKELLTAVRRRQDEVRHTPGRAGWQMPSQLRLPEGTGGTKAEQHHAEALDRPTVEREAGTLAGKHQGGGGPGQTDRRVGWSTRSSAATQRELADGTGRGWASRSSWTFPGSLDGAGSRFQPFLLKMVL